MHLLSWMLAIPYLIAGVAVAMLAWMMGGIGLVGRKSPVSDNIDYVLKPAGYGFAERAFQMLVRLGLGLTILSWVGAATGVSGVFSAPVVFPVIALAVLAGYVISRRNKPAAKIGIVLAAKQCWQSWLGAALSERLIFGIVTIAFILLCVNALIGAMVPDMNQDPMWYHLSVPQQWVFDGRYNVYPSVMPSAYPLSVESIFGVLFLVKIDPVICSVLTALSGIGLFVAMTVAGMLVTNEHKSGNNQWTGALAVAGVWVPIIALFGLLAPLQPKNDVIVIFWTFCAAMSIWIPSLRNRPVSASTCCVSGFLLGTAASGKPSVMVISAIVLCFWFVWSVMGAIRRDGELTLVIRGAAACVIAILVAMMPWMIRGYLTHGLPLFPLGQKLFPIHPEFQPLMNTFNAIHGHNADLSGGVLGALAQFPARFIAALQRNENALFAYLVIAIGGLVAASGRWRWYAFMLLAQVGLIILVRDRVVYRLMAPAYTLAVPMLAYGVVHCQDKIRRPVRLAAAMIIIALVWVVVVDRQIRVSKFHTYTWRFHPVLSEADVNAYAEYTEIGATFLRFAKIRQIIPMDARVLVLDTFYPFYLHRDATWNDEAVSSGGLIDRWDHFSIGEARQFLKSKNINYVLTTKGSQSEMVADNCVDAGFLTPIESPEAIRKLSSKIYRVK